jgi:hypothetical protein
MLRSFKTRMKYRNIEILGMQSECCAEKSSSYYDLVEKTGDNY